MNDFPSSTILAPIKESYLLATGIPSYVGKNGHRYFDELWIKDIIEHTKYLEKLTLMGPVIYADPPLDYLDVSSVMSLSGVGYVDLPGGLGTLGSLLRLPRLLKIFWSATKANAIIHTGVGGWPIPYGWILTPMAKLTGKRLVIHVESAFWRLTPEVRASLKTRIRAGISEGLGRWCVNNADLALFTQEEYKTSLLTKGKSPGYVDPASWIDEDKIIPEHEAQSVWNEKSYPEVTRLKVVFVGRLNEKKGIRVLLSALDILESKKIPIDLDILGEGDLYTECSTVANKVHRYINIKMLGTVPYDNTFHHLLRAYHLVVVPTLSDEQPRIIYDAFSQAVPVFASNTAGNRDCINSQTNGILFEPNSAVALCNAIEWAMANVQKLRFMGINAAKEASHKTHSSMHRRRWALLANLV